MPHHKSAKKRLLTSKARNEMNRADRSQLRTAIKSFRGLATPEAKAEQLPQIASLLDVHARKGLLHKNKASRLKSRLSALTQK